MNQTDQRTHRVNVPISAKAHRALRQMCLDQSLTQAAIVERLILEALGGGEQ